MSGKRRAKGGELIRKMYNTQTILSNCNGSKVIANYNGSKIIAQYYIR